MTDDIVFIQITLKAGRTLDQKKALYGVTGALALYILGQKRLPGFDFGINAPTPALGAHGDYSS